MPYTGKSSRPRRGHLLKLISIRVQGVYFWWFTKSHFFKITVITFCSFSWLIAWMFLYSPKRFTIQHIQLLSETTQEANSKVKAIALTYIGKGIFAINPRTLQTKLLDRFSWIESVIVKRRLSGTLMIEVAVRKPIARFENIEHTDSKVSLIDDTGYVFEPTQNIEHFEYLPYLKGLTNLAKYILHFYKELNTILQAQNLKITQLQLDREMRFNVELSNGMWLLLGHVNPLHQLKCLLGLNFQVLHRTDQIASIDLRYARGIAVKLHESIK